MGPPRSFSSLEGLPHVPTKLDAKQYESSVFAQELLDILRVFGVPSWSQTAASYPVPSIQKVSGSLTNAVFFVSSPSTSSCTLLLRLFGPSSGSLVARSYELHVLHLLSSRYKLGPRIYGTFTNGRVEEYFDSVALTASNMREPRISGYIGARMAELHSIDLATIKELSRDSNIEIGVWKNVRSWLPRARDALPAITPTIREELSLDVFQKKWEGYIQWLKDTQDTRAVFCHNDVHYGNILRLNSVNEVTPEHHRIVLVDFEYASPNPAAFDIANHFHEWTANYHGPTPHVLDTARYPNYAKRRTFLTAYLENRTTPPDVPAFRDLPPAARERELVALEKAVCAWSPSSHAMWAMWGMVQSRQDVQACVAQPKFDYVSYARGRMATFYRELAVLGL